MTDLPDPPILVTARAAPLPDGSDQNLDDARVLATFTADDLLSPGDTLDLPQGPMVVVSTQERVGDNGIEQVVTLRPVRS